VPFVTAVGVPVSVPTGGGGAVVTVELPAVAVAVANGFPFCHQNQIPRANRPKPVMIIHQIGPPVDRSIGPLATTVVVVASLDGGATATVVVVVDEEVVVVSGTLRAGSYANAGTIVMSISWVRSVGAALAAV
jgi:hypothetical protein